MDGILGSLGIDPFYLFIIMFMLQVALIVLLVSSLRQVQSSSEKLFQLS